MLETPQGLAGQLVELDTIHWRLPHPEQLTGAMRSYIQDGALLAEHKQRAIRAFGKFHMKRCVNAYKRLFNRACATVQSPQETPVTV